VNNVSVFRSSNDYPCLVTFQTSINGNIYDSIYPIEIFNFEDYNNTIPKLKDLFLKSVISEEGGKVVISE